MTLWEILEIKKLPLEYYQSGKTVCAGGSVEFEVCLIIAGQLQLFNLADKTMTMIQKRTPSEPLSTPFQFLLL